jgi:hypothetical protein
MDICRTPTFSRSVFAIVSMFAGLFAGLLGVMTTSCGGEDTYSSQHQDAIQYDCQQTAPCDPVFSIKGSGAVGECIRDTSTKLDRGSDSFRAMYEQRFTRCAQNSGCQYFACAGDSMLFSIVNEDKLVYDCQQTTFCKIMQGMPTAPNENDMCFQTVSQKLDFSSVPDRAAWEQRFVRCGMQQSCAYVNCK